MTDPYNPPPADRWTTRLVPEHQWRPDDNRLSCSQCGLPASNRHHHAGRPDPKENR